MEISDPYTGHNILVTGGSGYIGSFLANKLENIGHKVTTTSTRFINRPNHLRVDLTNENKAYSILSQLKDIDTIIHCAAIAHGKDTPNEMKVGEFNSLILKNLLNIYKSRKIHWIFLSSISVYGDHHSKKNIPINKKANPFESYGIGKLHDENYLIKNCEHLDILRLMPVYDKQNLDDIKKRVFFPRTNIKVLVKPSPKYSLCNIEEVLYSVKSSMRFSSGQRCSNVGDAKPLDQETIATWFSGKVLYMPQFLFCFIFALLPKKVTYMRNIAFMIKKYALNNIYQIKTTEINQDITNIKTKNND